MLWLVVEEIAERMSDGRSLEQVGRDLVQQRLERVVVVLVDEDDVHVGVLQLPGRADAGEASAQDHDARPRSSVCAITPHRNAEVYIFGERAETPSLRDGDGPPRGRARLA